MRDYRKILALLGAFAASPGCAGQGAGTATSPIDQRFEGGISIYLPPPTAIGAVTFTITINSATVTPTSTAEQKQDQKVDLKADITPKPIP